MNTPQLTDSIRRIFTEEKHRLVFWYDERRDFEETLASLDLGDVTVLRTNEVGALELKIKLEMEDTSGAYLLYAPHAEPAPEDDWLLDVRLYSRTFYADSASLVLGELGLSQLSLREHLAARQLFLRSQDRLARLKRWVRPEDGVDELELKMLAVLVRADQPEENNVLIKLLGEYCQDGECDLTNTPRAWAEIERYELAPFFWRMMRSNFGYESSEPKLGDLLIRLLVTDFAQDAEGATLPAALRGFMLPNKSLALNASVLLSQWRKNIAHYPHYDTLSRTIEREMNLDDHLAQMDVTALHHAETFESVERRISSVLRDRLVGAPHEPRADELREIVRLRLNQHWTRGEDNPHRLVYRALQTAADLLELRRKYDAGFSYESAEAMFAAYTNELYRFDQLYRSFHEAADQVELHGWDNLRSLSGIVEKCYSNWYLDQLAVAWGAFVGGGAGEKSNLLTRWQLAGVKNQQDFYRAQVKSLLDAAPQSKVFVIISDALRYEAAEELARAVNDKDRLKATIEAQLGVLPSYTALGMAALLPHETLDYKTTGATPDVTADNLSTAGIEKRAEILARVDGTAIHYDDLISLNKEQGREFVKLHRVIYIYHNQIDAIGDKQATEGKTFDAVRTAIDELGSLVKRIVNNFNGSQIIITADHGFLYQEAALTAVDRSELGDKPAGSIIAKKRYLIGAQLGARENVWHGRIRATAGIAGEMEFWIPRGANRFHFVSGARFVHGGAMLQEIAVPLVFVKSLRGQAAEHARTRKVDVSRLGSSNRIVTAQQRFEFIQSEPVSEYVKPLTLKIAMRDVASLADISNEVTLTFDSQSPLMDERKKIARLTLKQGQYDKNHPYELVMRDAVTNIEYAKIPMTVDLAFGNDF